MQEEYRIIEDYPIYSVSNIANVRNDISGKVLKPQDDSHGYKQVGLSKNSSFHSKG